MEEADRNERILVDDGRKIRGKIEGAKGTVESRSWSGNPRDPSMARRRAAKTLQDNEKKRWIWRNCSPFPTFLAIRYSRTRRMIQQIIFLHLAFLPSSFSNAFFILCFRILKVLSLLLHRQEGTRGCILRSNIRVRWFVPKIHDRS